MKRFFAILAGLMALFVSMAQAQSKSQRPMEHMSGLLQLVETIPLPVDGYMDHLTADDPNLYRELTITRGGVQPTKGPGWETSILSDLITEDAHLLVFDDAP